MAWFANALRATTPAPHTRPAEAAHTLAPTPCLAVVPQSPAPASAPRRRAAKPARVFRLYPEPEKPAAAHARALLELLREQCPEAAGQWLIVDDLRRTYAELAKRERWSELAWCSIGRELATLTRRRTLKRHGKRFVAYLLR